MTDRSPSARGDSPSLAQAAKHLQLLVETGLLLAHERSIDVIVQAALDAGLKLCGAAFGAFFYNSLPDHGRYYQLYKVAGVDPAAFSRFPMPRPTAVFAESFVHGRILRSGDITQDPRYGHNAPYKGMPAGHLPVRSYLSVPVIGRSGETLGAILYGHPDPDVFNAECESLVATIAAQAAVAMDNASLTENLTSEIAIADAARQLQRETSQRLEQAFEDMAESSRRLREALEAGALGTWSWDMATDRMDLDERASQLLFAEPHTPIRRADLRRRIVHTDDLPNTPADLGEAVLSGGTYSAEYRVEGPGKRQRWIAARGLATFNDARELTGMTGTVQDITDRKTQEASLRQSEKLAATGRLAATIAHEINNPLEAVTNIIYLCKTDATVPPDVQRLLQTADEELARVAQIAQQTLGFYRDTTRPGEIDLSAMLHGIVELFSRKLEFKRLACRTHIQPGLRLYGLQARSARSSPTSSSTPSKPPKTPSSPSAPAAASSKAGLASPASSQIAEPAFSPPFAKGSSRPSSHPSTLSAPASDSGSRAESLKSTAAPFSTAHALNPHPVLSSESSFLLTYPIAKFSTHVPRDLSSRLMPKVRFSLHRIICTSGTLMFAGTPIPLGFSAIQDPRDERIPLQQQRLEQPL